MSETQLASTLDAIAQATETINENEPLFQRSQFVITVTVLAIWAFVVFGMFFWILVEGSRADEYICSTPPVDQADVGTDCVNSWTATRDALKDLVTFAVLPFFTLVLGFYFGRSTSEPDL